MNTLVTAKPISPDDIAAIAEARDQWLLISWRDGNGASEGARWDMAYLAELLRDSKTPHRAGAIKLAGAVLALIEAWKEESSETD